MTMQLADLDRDALLVLAEAQAPDQHMLSWARVEAARRREAAAYAAWKTASAIAIADARAARTRIEAERYDDALRALKAKSMASTHKARRLWWRYRKESLRRVALERELSRAEA